MDTVTVKNIEFTTHIGISERERSMEQTLYIDIAVTHTRSDFTDKIESTFDYVPLAQQIYALQQQTRELIETLGQEILSLCMADNRILSAEVTVHKPSALKNGVPSVTLKTKR